MNGQEEIDTKNIGNFTSEILQSLYKRKDNAHRT